MERRLILPGKPTQKGFIESFNGRFRDEGLKEHGFSDIVHPRKIINYWRQDYKDSDISTAIGFKHDEASRVDNQAPRKNSR